jgi:Rieske Fe-S protein
MTMRDLSRRTVLAGACGGCATVVAGCATYTTGRAAPTEIPALPSVAPIQPGVTPGETPASGTLAATSDIPVGGGKVFADADVVITQPTAGRFVAFSATCTHQGCTVSTITADTVNCPCHGSSFALADGSVVQGPASTPLPTKKITVSGGRITLA